MALKFLSPGWNCTSSSRCIFPVGYFKWMHFMNELYPNKDIKKGKKSLRY
jgi:hypothetical protein